MVLLSLYKALHEAINVDKALGRVTIDGTGAQILCAAR